MEISRLGTVKGTDPQVVAHRGRCHEFYAALSRELSDVAKAQGLVLAAEEDPHGENRLSHLAQPDPQFDLTYLDEQAALHRKLITLYAMEGRASLQALLREHAEEGRAVLTKNLAEIQQLEHRLREVRLTPGH
ncbi:MAG: DUF4142 domain-containing protein [Rhodospirillales bacterium]